MNETFTQLTLPLALTDIVQLAADANKRCMASNEPNEEEVIEHLACLYRDIEVVESSMRPPTMSSVVAPTVRTPFPASLDWVWIGHCVAALYPPVLRRRDITVSCEQPNARDFLIGAMTWRYLAMRLRMLRRCFARWGADGAHVAGHVQTSQEAEQSLVRAAKMQRIVLNCVLHCNATELPGGSTTLAVRTRDAAPCDGFLITVNKLGQEVSAEHVLIARARTALFSQRQCNINHNILMLDSIDNSSVHDTKYKVFDDCIHLIGNPNAIRFVIVVSDVPDLKGSSALHKVDTYEGRFRLNKSLLRDVFLGRLHKNVFSEQTKSDSIPVVVQNNSINTANSFYADLSLSAPTGDAELREKGQRGVEEGLGDETLISSNRIARKFFGYRGIRDLDS